MMWRDYFRPASQAEALELLARHPKARIVAGGTDVLVELQRGVKPTHALIDVSELHALRYLRVEGDELALGGLTTHNDVIASRLCVERAWPLVQACVEVGAPQIRTRATIAGNLVTASPANDTIVPLTALGATIVLRSEAGDRAIPIDRFFTGFRATAMRPDELLAEIRVRSMRPDERGVFLKLGLRRAQAISVISLACVVALDGERVREARIALGCVAPTIVRLPRTEALLAGAVLDAPTIARAARAAVEEIAPIDDVRGSAAYRRDTVEVYVSEALERIAQDRCGADAWNDPVLLDTGERSQPAPTFDGTIDATINGTNVVMRDAQTKTLLNALRENAHLTGAKEGCAEGECGACTVWIDGQAVMSCLVPAAQVHGKQLTTIEGLASAERLHPLQQAYIDCASVQCGFCIPGMLMAGAKGLQEHPAATLEQHQSAISGNLCRCTGYRKILDAMISVSESSEHAALPEPQTLPAPRDGAPVPAGVKA